METQGFVWQLRPRLKAPGNTRCWQPCLTLAWTGAKVRVDAP
jgi:hypothetical protein